MVLHQPRLGAARVRTPAAVAGVDLGTRDQREADALLLGLADHLAGLGLDDDATLMTHRAATAAGVHVALSVGLALEVGTAWALLHDRRWAAGGRTGDRGVFLAGRRSGPEDLADGAADAAAAAILRSGGRAVRFPGADRLTGDLTVAEVVERSAVDRVAVLAGGTACSDQVVLTRGFVRPTCHDGELVLLVQPAAGGTLVPFEVANPTACCADHG